MWRPNASQYGFFRKPWPCTHCTTNQCVVGEGLGRRLFTNCLWFLLLFTNSSGVRDGLRTDSGASCGHNRGCLEPAPPALVSPCLGHGLGPAASCRPFVGLGPAAWWEHARLVSAGVRPARLSVVVEKRDLTVAGTLSPRPPTSNAVVQPKEGGRGEGARSGARNRVPAVAMKRQQLQ